MSVVPASQNPPQQSIYLMVGDLYFGNQADEVKTLLGSCVAITLWHPKLFVGGMCHIALPESRDDKHSALNTRFADGAINRFISYISEIDTQPKEYVVNLYGGGQMFNNRDKDNYNDVGAKNIANTKRLLAHYRFNISKEDLSGPYYRHVCLNLRNGHVELRKTPVSETMG